MPVGQKLTVEVKFSFTGFASQVIISKAQRAVRARVLFDGQTPNNLRHSNRGKTEVTMLFYLR